MAKEPRATAVKYPKALAKVKGVLPGESDSWDGIQHMGADLWSVYRTPIQALLLTRSAFPAVWDARPHTIPVPDKLVIKVVYTSRGKGTARSVHGLGEKALLDALRKSFEGSSTVLVRHTGKETIDGQREIFADVRSNRFGSWSLDLTFSPIPPSSLSLVQSRPPSSPS